MAHAAGCCTGERMCQRQWATKFSPHFFNELIIKAKKHQDPSGTVGDSVINWLGTLTTGAMIAEQVQALEIKWVTDGQTCRI